MAEEVTERRLAAIMSADVAGYSRLMGADETGTLAALKALRKDVFAPQVAAHKGRVVKLMGDGALVEFPSIVNAVDCAVAVQRALADEAIKLRIGINLGDIIIEGSDIYGDGVNVAARIQEVAEPGGIALSATAHEHAAAKVDGCFRDGGEHDLKNIAKPVRIYHWTDEIFATTGLAEPLALPDKPSIAVLPFTNMSGDAEQEYFSDGISEDIITELSRFRSLFVIARNSSFHYKGQSPKVQEVGRELGVQYVVEGSVRKASNRVRITAQLIEAESGNHLWAERYDRNLDDIFAVQDDVVRRIASTLVGRLEHERQERTKRQTSSQLTHQDRGDSQAAPPFQRGERCANAESNRLEAAQRPCGAHGAPHEGARDYPWEGHEGRYRLCGRERFVTVAHVMDEIAILEQSSTGALKTEWRGRLATEPPSHASDEYMRSVLAYRIQERAGPKLSKARRRKLEGLAGGFETNPGYQRTSATHMKPSVRLLREWNGETHEVTVLRSGFEYRSARYRSLSMIARVITGARWSGPRFFGLKRAGKELADGGP